MHRKLIFHAPTRPSTAALALCMFVYVIVGLFGYLTFFDTIQGNILVNYENKSEAVMVGRVGVGIVILCSFPLLMNPW